MRKAGELLHLPAEQIAVQHGLIGPDLIYAWDSPRGRTAIVNLDLNAMEFESGLLLQDALAKFRKTHPEAGEARSG